MNQKKLNTNQLVKQAGQYLYRHIDGAYKGVSSSNTYDVYFVLYYQLKVEDRDPSKGEEYNDVHEMKLNISLTTYSNKIRVNIHELTPDNCTIGYIILPPEKLQDPLAAKKMIYDKVIQKVVKRYSEYDFIF